MRTDVESIGKHARPFCEVCTPNTQLFTNPMKQRVKVHLSDMGAIYPMPHCVRIINTIADDIAEHIPFTVVRTRVWTGSNLRIRPTFQTKISEPIINYKVINPLNPIHEAIIDFDYWVKHCIRLGEPQYGLYHLFAHVILHSLGCLHHDFYGIMNSKLDLIYRSITGFDADFLSIVPSYDCPLDSSLRKDHI